MRISDWSSDVCSSDLVLCSGMAGSNLGWADAGYLDVPAELGGLAYRLTVVPAGDSVVHLVPGLRATGPLPDVMRGEERSEERRVGKECVRTCGSRWSPET